MLKAYYTTYLIHIYCDYLTLPLSISTWFSKYRVSLDFFSISNSKKKSISKLDFLSSSNLIFTACVACKNQVRTRKKIEFRNRFFFRVCNKLPNWHFKNQVQIDTAWGSDGHFEMFQSNFTHLIRFDHSSKNDLKILK